MQGTIPSIPSMGKGHRINVIGGGGAGNYLRDTSGNLILDSNGNPIDIIGS